MSRIKKLGADAVQEAALGHNRPDQHKMEIAILRRFSKITEDITILQDGAKAILREAKDIGMSKMGVRKAVKEMRMSLEQLQARQEVEDAKNQYIHLYKQTDMFAEEEAA